MRLLNKTILPFLFFALVFNPKSSKATHAFGAQLTYTCINSNTYVIWYTLYRDCSGIFPASSILINVTNTCGFVAQSINIPQVVSPIDLSPPCPQDIPSTCNGGIHIGVQKYIYSDTIVLGGSCNWTISHAESSRSSALTTITGAGSDDLFVYCLINNTLGNNNSPVFSSEPSLYVCLNTAFSIDQGCYDIDGDSLAMQMISPLVATGSIVSYYSGYSGTQPLISSPPMIFNPLSGILNGYPLQTDFSVYAILVSEYRSGVLIGQVERDLSLVAKSCANTIPDLTGFDGTTNYNITVLPNVQSCFKIAAIDPDSGQLTSISIGSSIGGLSFSNTGTIPDSAIICWTPSLSDSLNNPNCFTLDVSDNACPFNANKRRTYCIDVSLIDNIQNRESLSFNIYPNPFLEELVLNTNRFSNYEVKIVDITGRIVYQTRFTEKKFKLNQSSLEDGIYLISVQDLLGKSQQSWMKIICRH